MEGVQKNEWRAKGAQIFSVISVPPWCALARRLGVLAPWW
jgi:hypothetical protein